MNNKWKSICCESCNILPKSQDDITYIKKYSLCYDCYSVAKIKGLNIEDETHFRKSLKIIKDDEDTKSRIVLNERPSVLAID